MESNNSRNLIEPARVEGAFLAAAVGDALGWPYEARAKRAGGASTRSIIGFEDWHKRSGGRFYPHDEHIAQGEYSDDTQLIIACARSLLSAEKWWEHFAFVELPFWTTYERGGGGATRRSAKQLAAGSLPWETKKRDDRMKYFEAGGNGIAMRILPHCLKNSQGSDFGDLALDVMSDGVCTHGHPRAIVGALAYAFGLWAAFRHRGTLEYGALLQWTLDGFDNWSKLPDISERWGTWISAATQDIPNYTTLWRQASEEMQGLLKVAVAGLAGGALSVDEETLEALGCFNPKINGAGTVAAAASLFLASRHAVDPIEGITRAAQARGADTDTIASMTGALLGAVAGGSWLTEFQFALQDRGFLCSIATRLAQQDRWAGGAISIAPVQKTSIVAFIKLLHAASQGSFIVMPNGVHATVFTWDGVLSNSRNLQVFAWRIVTEDGQSIFVKELIKNAEPVTARTDLFHEEKRSVATRIGLTILVSDLEKSREFYENAIGLEVQKMTSKSVNFGGVLAVKLGARSEEMNGDISLFVEVEDIADCYRRVSSLNSTIISEPSQKSGRAFFVCRDPDNYIVEIYQHQ